MANGFQFLVLQNAHSPRNDISRRTKKEQVLASTYKEQETKQNKLCRHKPRLNFATSQGL